MPSHDLSMVEDEELVREYLRLHDVLVHSKTVSRDFGAEYDAHAEELKRRGFDLRPGVLERWLREVE